MNRIATVLSIAVLLLTGAASAQFNDQKLTANIPFDFVVGTATLPAGQYTFLRTGNNQLLVRSAEGRSVATVVTGSVEAVRAPANSKLRFETINGNHVLVQVWKEDATVGSALYYPRSEKYTAVHATSAGRR